MLNFTHEIPTKLYFGEGQISRLDELLRPFGRRVLLAYGGGSIKRIGLYVLAAAACYGLSLLTARLPIVPQLLINTVILLAYCFFALRSTGLLRSLIIRS